MRGMLVYEWWHVGSIVFQLVFHAISSLWNPNWWNPKWMDPIPPRWSPERLFGVVYTFKWSSWIDLGMVYGIDHRFTNHIQLCSFCVPIWPILVASCTTIIVWKPTASISRPMLGICLTKAPFQSTFSSSPNPSIRLCRALSIYPDGRFAGVGRCPL